MTDSSDSIWDVAVLGGGWAGLLSARELRARDPKLSVIVLERETRAQSGGLLQTVIREGFTFDCGGPHILFSKYPETLAEVSGLLGENQVRRPRRSYVFFDGQFVPYPFENGIYLLSETTRSRLGEGLLEAHRKRTSQPDWRPENFEQWVYGFFGTPMGKEYLEPYNLKIWKRPLQQLSADWVYTPGRVPTPSLDAIHQAMKGEPSVGYKEQSEFVYPRIGGIRALYEAALNDVERAGVPVRFGTRVEKVERSNGLWHVNGSISARVLVNTLPLPALLGSILTPSPNPTWVQEFDYNRVLVVGIALSTPTPDQTAIYVPQGDVPFHRYTWMSYLTSCPSGCSNLICEVTIPHFERPDPAKLTDAVVRGLSKIGVIRKAADVLFVESWLNEYGYPIYTHRHKEATAAALSGLAAEGIYSVGRWGSWEYWNTDMVLRAVKKTAGELLLAVRG